MFPKRLIVVGCLIGVGLVAHLYLGAFDIRGRTVAAVARVGGSAGSGISGVFEGITPCSEFTKPVPQITSPCEQMIWKLTLYQDPDRLTPTTYELHSAYGFPKQNTPGLTESATRIDMDGKWAIVKGAKTDPDAVVYQLNPDHQQAAVYFLRLDENILHVLDRDRSMMVGNAAWSYTLNRTDARLDRSEAAHPLFQETTVPSEHHGSSMLGVFDGRVPCHEIALEFAGISAEPDCVKIKWRLTLSQDPNTGAPTTYRLQGTRTTREGKWTIVRGTQADPEAIVYKLDLGRPQAAGHSVYFLRADDNHLMLLDREGNLLVGTALWSYTLSRGDDTF
jgi:hypothetical protein